ncbi:SDR family oxidoreductase [Shouchella patagoniensis]|uniref:SDR family oxidoreductase n=1 Tax=Shouchella patagoniensis TaxID=228576 RepID=UPI000994E78C|nr:SDR family NAD(P)-dependent oxidoreductase [Shouchella patagoniensis]
MNMNELALVTNGESYFNQHIAQHLKDIGFNVIIIFRTLEGQSTFEQSLSIEGVHTRLIDKLDERAMEFLTGEIQEKWGTLDVLIHGNEELDEEKSLAEDSERFGYKIEAIFNEIFFYNKMATSLMIKKKTGKIIFPLIYDPLYYAEYCSSPVLNQGKISLMKCLSRELGAFRINVNAITFGYHRTTQEGKELKELKRKVEIFSLKPQLPQLKDMIPALDMLVAPPVQYIGGENIHIGVGIETSL